MKGVTIGRADLLRVSKRPLAARRHFIGRQTKSSDRRRTCLFREFKVALVLIEAAIEEGS